MDAIEAALRRLVADAVLSGEQAQAVRDAVAARQPQRRVGPLVEALGYLGATLASVSAIALTSEFWADLTDLAQAGVLGLTGVALWAAGQWIAGGRDDAVRRLVGVLWLLAVAAFGGAAGVVADGLAGLDPEQATLAVGLAVTVPAGLLYAVHRGALQQLGLLAGALTTVVGGLLQFERPPDELFGLAVWALGAAWALLAWGGQLRPLRTGAAAGTALALCSAQGLTFALPDAGLALALGSTVAAFGAAAATRQLLFAGLGIAGVAVFVPQALDHWFGDRIGAAGVLFVTGVLLLAGALAAVHARRNATEVEVSRG